MRRSEAEVSGQGACPTPHGHGGHEASHRHEHGDACSPSLASPAPGVLISGRGISLSRGGRTILASIDIDIAPGDPAYVDLTKHGFLNEGESIGASTGAIYKEMIRETIREHIFGCFIEESSGLRSLDITAQAWA